MSRVPSNWQWRRGPLDAGRAVVFDMDGVLCNADERQHFITDGNRDWKGFFEACGTDAPIERTTRLMRMLSEDMRIVLLTGRPIEVQPATLGWLEREALPWDLLIMRDRGHYGESLVFKQQSVRRLRLLGFDVELAFEDDQRNLEMFEAEGVPCIYVHSGYYDARDAMNPGESAAN